MLRGSRKLIFCDGVGPGEPVPDDVLEIQAKLDDAQATIQQQKRQIMEIAADANRRHNEQQNQLQGVEAVS